MDYHNNIITKYSSDYIPSLDDLMLEFKQIKPCMIPIYDITALRFLGGFAHMLINYYKWEIMDDYIDNFKQMMEIKFPGLKYDIKVVNDIFNNYKNAREAPTIFSNKLYNYLIKLKKTPNIYTDKNYVNEYFDFRDDMKKSLDELLFQYEDRWVTLNSKFEEIITITYSNFKHLETDELYIMTNNIIDQMNEEAGNKIDDILIELNVTTNDFMSSIKTYDPMMRQDIIREYTEKIKNKFIHKMDEIYLEIIKNKGYPDDVNHMLYNLFDVEKAIYLSCLLMDIHTHNLEQLVKIN